MSAFWRLANRTSGSRSVASLATMATCFVSLQSSDDGTPMHSPFSRYTQCDVSHTGTSTQTSSSSSSTTTTTTTSTNEKDRLLYEDEPPERVPGMHPDAPGDYYGLFPARQLWHPKYDYPLWDKNWDDRHPESTGDTEEDRKFFRHLRKTGVTRHIILIRHGQYDESSKEDEKRVLTPLGREQAHLTGKRIAEMVRGAEEQFGPCNITAIRVSALVRAKETAEIIAQYLPNLPVEESDPLLNEGRPCHTIPGGPMTDKIIEVTDHHHPRIEEAFRKYFYRAPVPEKGPHTAEEKHEFEIIVGHANCIRYMMCRALQLPPETWLRFCPFNCSLTYLTIRPTGTVSCRLMGDIGHLPYNKSTFSGHHGYNW